MERCLSFTNEFIGHVHSVATTVHGFASPGDGVFIGEGSRENGDEEREKGSLIFCCSKVKRVYKWARSLDHGKFVGTGSPPHSTRLFITANYISISHNYKMKRKYSNKQLSAHYFESVTKKLQESTSTLEIFDCLIAAYPNLAQYLSRSAHKVHDSLFIRVSHVFKNQSVLLMSRVW